MDNGIVIAEREWKAVLHRADKLRGERDEARGWCAVLILIILMLSMALGYVLAQGVV